MCYLSDESIGVRHDSDQLLNYTTLQLKNILDVLGDKTRHHRLGNLMIVPSGLGGDIFLIPRLVPVMTFLICRHEPD